MACLRVGLLAGQHISRDSLSHAVYRLCPGAALRRRRRGRRGSLGCASRGEIRQRDLSSRPGAFDSGNIHAPDPGHIGRQRRNRRLSRFIGQKEIAIRPICVLNLSYDHRSIDGAEAAKFLQRLKLYLQNPTMML